MCHWKKWIWPGILTIGLLSLLALYFKSAAIEQDLNAKATAALSGAGLGWASVEMDGRDATILGVAPSEDAQDAAEVTALGAYDVRIADNITTLLASQSPYKLNAKRSGDSLTLSGFVPDDATRETIVSSAKEAVPGVNIVDEMKAARGAPAGLAAMAGFGLAQLKGLSNGEMSLSDVDLTVKGAADTFDTFNGVNAALDGALPAGAKLAMKDITPPAVSPYTWAANFKGNSVVLEGFVPSAEVGSNLAAKAKEALGVEVSDQQIVAMGAPEGFENAAKFSIDQLPRFTSGNVGLSDLNLSVEGVSKNAGAFSAATTAIAAGAALPAGLALAEQNIAPSTVSPYTWNADYNGSKVVLGGFVPTAEVRDDVLAQTKAKLPSAEIVDEMQIAVGAPADFRNATRFAVSQLPRFTSGDVQLSDNNLTVNGIAKDPGSYDLAKNAVAGDLPANLALAAENIVPSTVSPYIWSADYDGAKVTLGGFVPTGEVRGDVLAQTKAKLPGTEVVDGMQIAAGAPVDFRNATRFAVSQLPRFTSGDVQLSDSNLTVNGVATDPAAYDLAKGAIAGDLPASLKLASEKILPATVSPYTWKADYDGSQVVVGGFVPTEDARKAILDDAANTLPNTKVVDELRIADGAPATFKEGTAFALDQLPRFSTGMVSLSDTNLAVQGVAIDAANYDAAKGAVAGSLPASLILNSERISPSTVSPYVWNADYNGKKVVLDGFVPDNRARTNIIAATKAQLPNATIEDKMQIANGAPASFEVAASDAISILPRFSEGDVALSDLDLTVNGKALSKGDYANATSKVNSDLGGSMNLAAANIQKAPDLGDYIWSAERRGNAIILAGNAPSKEERKGIAERAKALYPGVTVVNRIIPREDAPGGFIANADKGLGLLDRLSSGKASIRNRTMSIVGQASSVNNYDDSLTDIAKDLNYGYSWDVRDIKPVTVSPYTWALVKGDDTAVQSGFVPSRGTGNVLVAATKATLGKDVEDNQRVALGAPENFGNAVSSAISAVNMLGNSRASITDTNMFVQGRASSEEEADALGKEIEASIPANFKLRKQISYPLPKVVVKAPEPKPEPKPEPVVCQIDFPALFAGEKIRFATNRALIKEVSYPLLDRISEATKTCPETRFEIGGHTDSRGRDAYNQGLSEARAQAVVDYLGKSGVNSENLVAKGYGENSPIASNKTVEGRAQNRRIEFTLIPTN